MTTLKIIPFYASLLSLLYIFLSFLVIKGRRRAKIGLGTGEDRELLKYVRIHANFAEYIPLALLLCAFLELNSTSSLSLHVLGLMLFLGRIFHCAGITKSPGVTKSRFSGMLLTYLVLISASIMLICNFFK